jgi:hypothetical protein
MRAKKNRKMKDNGNRENKKSNRQGNRSGGHNRRTEGQGQVGTNSGTTTS